jgi:hypothetical protein
MLASFHYLLISTLLLGGVPGGTYAHEEKYLRSTSGSKETSIGVHQSDKESVEKSGDRKTMSNIEMCKIDMHRDDICQGSDIRAYAVEGIAQPSTLAILNQRSEQGRLAVVLLSYYGRDELLSTIGFE